MEQIIYWGGGTLHEVGSVATLDFTKKKYTNFSKKSIKIVEKKNKKI